GCGTRSGAEPNTLVCPVCLGYPGTMPAMNREAVRLTVLSGMMLGCRIADNSKFNRKSYFYPDMPKNYQISQYDRPLCLGGAVEIAAPGGTRSIGITRIHLEEDVAKNTHHAACSGVDFNRAGIPLMELVSEPDMHSPAEAFAFLHALRQILVYAGVSDCNLELGNMRCDANISLRPAGQTALGTKTEIKNLNTFKGVQAALEFEIERQARVLDGGGRISQETRRWDSEMGVTETMRSKEDAHDYRYFPEPDLLPVALATEQLEAWRATLPELPAARRARMMAEYGIPEYDAGVLAADRAVADFFEAVARQCGNGKTASNWIMTEVLRLLTESGKSIGESALTPATLAELIGMVAGGVINQPTAKALLPELFAGGGSASALVAARGLAQVGDAGAIERWVAEVFAANPGPVADFRAGKAAAAGFLVGQAMKLSRGKADPKQVSRAVHAKLAARDG
ncbi:MAG: Asp-tRNA(Asn)/Glu-tRNA(Gln) amidotransferase subunit GatB, partial [Kiritimatiellae bacterium]|nr:Asp-tRNA(Asn)/Glu-tRNA(Gln) amidotransferase subunit GatB [Kiritimatiellia bacterium]